MLEVRESGGESCSVAVRDEWLSATHWRCALAAIMRSGAQALVKRWTVLPRSWTGAPSMRLLVVASVPGAVGWSLSVEADGPSPTDTADFDLTTQELSGPALGCQLVDSGSVEGVDGWGERGPYRVRAGVSGVATIPPNELVMKWSAWSSVATGSVAIARGGQVVMPAVTIPAGGAISGAPEGALRGRALPPAAGPCQFTFIDTDGFMIECKELFP